MESFPLDKSHIAIILVMLVTFGLGLQRMVANHREKASKKKGAGARA
jgi:hypothetical protein